MGRTKFERGATNIGEVLHKIGGYEPSANYVVTSLDSFKVFSHDCITVELLKNFEQEFSYMLDFPISNAENYLLSTQECVLLIRHDEKCLSFYLISGCFRFSFLFNIHPVFFVCS